MTDHRRTPEQRQEYAAKKKALLDAIRASGDWAKLARYDPLSLTKWSVGELEAGLKMLRYDEAHPDRFKGDGRKALKELYGEVAR